MNEKTKIMISLGAATACNCIPCFDHLYCHAKSLGITDQAIQTIVDISTKVKNGAHIAIKTTINEALKNEAFQADADFKSKIACTCGCIQ